MCGGGGGNKDMEGNKIGQQNGVFYKKITTNIFKLYL